MNLKELFEFKNFISSNNISLSGAQNGLSIQDLFKKFSEYDIHSKKDYKSASKHFKSTMTHLYRHINSDEDFTKQEFLSKLNIFCNYIHNTLNPTFARIQKQSPYVEVVKTLIPPTDKVLDVGAGIIPHSSFMMAPSFKEVQTLDKFAISESSLSPFHVKAKDGYFDEATNVEDVDFIVGNRPCSAIKKIVEQASLHNKGYVLKLCDCDLGNIAYETGKGYRNWDEILPEIDSRVQFCEGYAYNVDASVEQFLKITEATQIENRYKVFEGEAECFEQDITNAQIYFEKFNCEQ